MKTLGILNLIIILVALRVSARDGLTCCTFLDLQEFVKLLKHADFTDRKRNVKLTRFLAFLISTVVAPAIASAQAPLPAPSFDCAKERGVIEQAICRDPKLAALDKQLQQAFLTTLVAMPAEAASAIRAGERDWLGYRNECERPVNKEGISECLTRRITARIQIFHDAVGKDRESATVQAVTSFIPEHPDTAAKLLRQYPDNPLGQAWLAYLSLHYPASGVNESERRSALQRAEANADHSDQAWAEYTPTDVPRAQAIYYLLRLLLRDNPDPGLVTCAHAFVFRDDWPNASKAFGGLNFSHRDDGAPYCEPMNGLFWLPAWRTMDAAFSTPIDITRGNSGSMSSGVLANMKLDAVRMTITPQSYGTAQNIRKIDQSVRAMKAWNDQKEIHDRGIENIRTLWPRADRDRAIANIPATIRETEAWAMHYYGLPPDEAQRAAKGIVGTYLDSWISWILDPEGE
ncbi:hypothetical protein R75461_07252 [Paraburkholderia nemoris]|uniref:lysozyme inhibitor LprI family protein n=1 Tax=Paraburkholderia nemoris TaxID=2793076 RepID=UPI00190B5060|nr:MULTISPECIES: lysozyme inhibitor LprI family protein [Paraburkholderia]MBK3786093.1 DUF1311 domain-containing protein [Paraburkholderia aspalathi]CAE6846185.1 hypothetical protein R75461_07252 [Paraburkholderia nemoris]